MITLFTLRFAFGIQLPIEKLFAQNIRTMRRYGWSCSLFSVTTRGFVNHLTWGLRTNIECANLWFHLYVVESGLDVGLVVFVQWINRNKWHVPIEWQPGIKCVQHLWPTSWTSICLSNGFWLRRVRSRLRPAKRQCTENGNRRSMRRSKLIVFLVSINRSRRRKSCWGRYLASTSVSLWLGSC